jgi:hypothetical protein
MMQSLFVMAGLVPAIPLRNATPCHYDGDHRVTRHAAEFTLAAYLCRRWRGPVMTGE